jgi:hypothetical protein
LCYDEKRACCVTVGRFQYGERYYKVFLERHPLLCDALPVVIIVAVSRFSSRRNGLHTGTEY